METITRYFAHVQSKLNEVLEHELPNIEKAAEFVAESCKNGGRFYVFGSGIPIWWRRSCTCAPADWLWSTPSCLRS